VRILHLEDDSADALLVQRAMQKSGLPLEIIHALTATEYTSAVESGRIDLIVADHGLPGFSGRAALEIARAKSPHVPFLIVSRADESEITASLQAGAAEFVHKNDLSQLGPVIRHIHATIARDRAQAMLERQNQAMKRLVAAVQDLSLARTLEAVMVVVRRAARELTGADGATFILRDVDKCFYADEDAIAPLWKGQRFPMTACISGWAMLNRQPAVIEDIYSDPRIPVDAYRPTFVKSLVMVPIRTHAPIGAIGNYWAQRHLATAQEVEVLQALANTTAVALDQIQLYSDLERRVQDRTLQLQEANRELEAFSYSVSHDLRAPLQHITGFASILEQECGAALDGKARGYLQRIYDGTGQMAGLIDDLLRLAKLVRIDLKFQIVNLSQLAGEIVAHLKFRDPGRSVELIIEDNLEVEGDPGLLNAALENLFSNAWKYSAKRERARIEFGSTTQPGGSKAYFVRDNGAGFDMRYADRLFAPFQRLHHQEEFAGHGVGLATVKRIIHRHGGSIWASAEPGRGATFWFTLASPYSPAQAVHSKKANA
jgi:signal transduction histidine kinase/DNA-binding response OmpR family regulator